MCKKRTLTIIFLTAAALIGYLADWRYASGAFVAFIVLFIAFKFWEREILRELQWKELFNTVCSNMSFTSSIFGIKKITGVILEELCEMEGIEAAWVMLKEPEGRFRLHITRGDLSGEDASFYNLNDYIGREIESFENPVVSEKHPAGFEFAGSGPVLHIPMMEGRLLFGIISVAARSRRLFKGSGFSNYIALGRQIQQLYENSSKSREMENMTRKTRQEVDTAADELTKTNIRLINRVKELKSLYNLSVRVFAAGDVKGAFREVFAEIKRVMKVSEAAYFELNNGLFNYVFSSFDSKFSMENKPALKKEFLSKNNGVKAAKDINAPDEIMSVFNKLSFRKIFVVPAKVGEKTKGLMIGGIKKKSKSFSQNELNTLTLYSSRLAEYIERNRMISVITEDNVRLKELNEVKNNFIALISHELRTPLTTIKGFSEVMYEGQTGDLTEEQKSCFKNILDSARLLGEKIDSIIDFVSLRKGDLEIKREKIQWNNLIEDVCSEFSDELERKNIKFTIKKDRKIGDVYVDAEKIKKAVRQLVSNAVKFNKIGGSINIKTKHRGDFFETVIKDNGIGIDEDMNSRIFEEFFQLEDPVTRSVNGIGIGLTLARSIFEVHGGTIEVKSKEKTGTRVNVLLPVKNRKYLRDKNPDGEKKNDK